MKWVHRGFAVLTFAPWGLWALAIAAVMLFGWGFGCDIDEGSVHPCMVLGRDMGGLAYHAGFWAAWGVLLFGPVSVGAALLWGVTAAIAAVVRRQG